MSLQLAFMVVHSVTNTTCTLTIPKPGLKAYIQQILKQIFLYYLHSALNTNSKNMCMVVGSRIYYTMLALLHLKYVYFEKKYFKNPPF